VLGFHAAEVAEVLETTDESVTSALKRARATLARDLPEGDRHLPPSSPDEQRLLDKLVAAWEHGDVDGIVALLTEDAWLRMPPLPLEYQGWEPISRFLSTVAFREGRRYRFVATRANGQPAFGVYLLDRSSGIARANAFFVVTLSADKISAIARFDRDAIARAGLPRMLPGG
jgi:RNA polymerase sigma-70 factor (ECF subfamily)